jgi:2,3-bisphosphoglycerate-dependent phosphoglycerate mutase
MKRGAAAVTARGTPPAGGGHVNTLRGLVMHLDCLSAEVMERVEIPSGVPLVYRFAPDFSVTGREWLERADAAPTGSR